MQSPPRTSTNMFHTFQGLSQPQSNSLDHDVQRSPTANASKRVTTQHACAECKRRKIRCDGKHPCQQCMGCRNPKPCHYDKHRQRVIPSRKTLDVLQTSLDECRAVINRLYPSRDPQTLLSLSRQELLSLLDRDVQTGSISLVHASPTGSNTSGNSQEFKSPLTSSDDNQSLANLEQIPSQDTEWDEERRNRDPIPAESDDVNALSLSFDRQASYMGASSIKAALMVMIKVAPRLRSYLGSPTVTRQNGSAYPQSQQRPGVQSKNPLRIAWSSEGQTLIDAYFNRVQIFVPMLDEPSFRADYLSGQRSDAPWLALLNMVFAMGSIAAMKSDDHSHITFYNRAREHLPLDCFGSSHLETLQALALMGGYYLHYMNRPNMANAITGAALRMACALGLHRESSTDVTSNPGNPTVANTRRRTWWTLFCLDTWAGTTLGRPSLGRCGPAITIRLPEGDYNANEPSANGQQIRILPLTENIKLAEISTAIQDAMAITPLPRGEDRAALDTRLVNWSDNLPWILRTSDPCPESLYTARCVLKWRYQNLRIILHRPVLLNIANRGNSYVPSSDEIAAVELCRSVAKQTIEDISREWTRNQMSGWNAVWYMYQAVMIPLVSIFWESWNTKRVSEWQHQIEFVLESFDGMVDWSLAARRSREVVSKMYEASKESITHRGSPSLLPEKPANKTDGDSERTGLDYETGESQNVGQQPDTMLTGDAMAFEHQNIWDLDGMLWGSLQDGLDMPFDGVPDFEYMDPNMSAYDGPYMMQQ